MPMSDIEGATALLDFWFGPPGSAEHDQPRAVWFTPDAGFDAALRQRFLGDYDRAAAGAYEDWKKAGNTCLALILLLDQLPRNLFRGSAQAFATDVEARAAARQALASGFDRTMPQVRRCFVYLPFEHSEDLRDQELSLQLFGALPPSDHAQELMSYARRHHEIIARFGRFPHRNRVLGRASTASEEAFLEEPGSTF